MPLAQTCNTPDSVAARFEPGRLSLGGSRHLSKPHFASWLLLGRFPRRCTPFHPATNLLPARLCWQRPDSGRHSRAAGLVGPGEFAVLTLEKSGGSSHPRI